MTVESNLESVKTNTPEVLPFIVYLPDDQAIGMDTMETELILNTNDSARVAITKLLSGQEDRYKDVNILFEWTDIYYFIINIDNLLYDNFLFIFELYIYV